MVNFIEKINKQLKMMTEKEKDAWILSQAKILSEHKQEDFYKSICGTKLIINMPEQDEIKAFCEKVKIGDISVEYETHYVEFDDYGHFLDDWEEIFHDPAHAMSFVSSVIEGCHDLIILEEYENAFAILEDIIGLEFTIEDHPDSDDICNDKFMNLDKAANEGLLWINRDKLLKDYITSCIHSSEDCQYVADKIADALEMELFRECKTFYCITIDNDRDPLLTELKRKLDDDLKRYKKEYFEEKKKNKYYWGEYRVLERIRHINELIEYFDKIGKTEKELENSFLRGTWCQISDLITELKQIPNVDDQIEIAEIWNIVEALIKRGCFDQEPWEIKESILKEIYENDYYDYCGIYDPMCDLAEAICSTKDEVIKRAEIMMKTGHRSLGVAAAKLYRELGEEDKCAEYFENHLGKETEPYEILVDYYKERDHEKAVEIANIAIQKCRGNLTQFFIILLQDAKDRGDDELFKKLMKSAHRRSAVESAEVDAKFS